jgi:hypothetical protein
VLRNPWLAEKVRKFRGRSFSFNRRVDGDRMIVNQSVSPANIDRTAQFLRLSVLVRVRIYGLWGPLRPAGILPKMA